MKYHFCKCMGTKTNILDSQWFWNTCFFLFVKKKSIKTYSGVNMPTVPSYSLPDLNLILIFKLLHWDLHPNLQLSLKLLLFPICIIPSLTFSLFHSSASRISAVILTFFFPSYFAMKSKFECTLLLSLCMLSSSTLSWRCNTSIRSRSERP